MCDKREVKLHLVGEAAGSFLCINSLRAHTLLEDLEKKIVTSHLKF
jgi:hypothetical protein